MGPCSLLLPGGDSGFFYGTLPCHPMQHPGPSNSFRIALFSLPSVSCLPLKVELLARFIETRRRAAARKKNQPAKPPLLAVAGTTALSFPLKISRMPWKTDCVLSAFTPTPFQSKELTRKGIISPKGYGFNKMVVPVADERGNNCIPHA